MAATFEDGSTSHRGPYTAVIQQDSAQFFRNITRESHTRYRCRMLETQTRRLLCEVALEVDPGDRMA